MATTITAFKQSPDEGSGLARDMPVRWALEEVGKRYEVRLVTFAELEESKYLALHPFGRIPAFVEGDLILFESGAIVLHIAQNHPGLLPADINSRARVVSWMFAALNTVEPPIVDFDVATILESDHTWFEERLSIVKDRIREVLGDLSHRLGDDNWLEGAFSAGDLLMVSVLRRLEGTSILEEFPNLLAYVARGKERPAFKRAFTDQLAVFTNNSLNDS